jgi:hypothetical protein
VHRELYFQPAHSTRRRSGRPVRPVGSERRTGRYAKRAGGAIWRPRPLVSPKRFLLSSGGQAPCQRVGTRHLGVSRLFSRLTPTAAD